MVFFFRFEGVEGAVGGFIEEYEFAFGVDFYGEFFIGVIGQVGVEAFFGEVFVGDDLEAGVGFVEGGAVDV